MSTIGIDLFREINNADERLLQWLEERGQLFPVEDDHGNERLYVENDLPRDAIITPLIVDATTGYALFTTDGEFVGKYNALDKAEAARDGAKIVVTPEVSVVEDVPAEEDI